MSYFLKASSYFSWFDLLSALNGKCILNFQNQFLANRLDPHRDTRPASLLTRGVTSCVLAAVSLSLASLPSGLKRQHHIFSQSLAMPTLVHVGRAPQIPPMLPSDKSPRMAPLAVTHCPASAHASRSSRPLLAPAFTARCHTHPHALVTEIPGPCRYCQGATVLDHWTLSPSPP
jgi:hypothetical protein